MAYRSRAYGYGRARRPLRRNGRFVLSRAKTQRYATTKRRVYRRRTTRRRPMTRRSILNVTSRKKQDKRATERQRLTGTNDPATVDDPSSRTSTNCFMRGLRENITLSLLSSHPWVWRRICFKFFGDSFDRNALDPALANIFAQFSVLTSSGYGRAISTFDDTNAFANDLRTRMQAYIFKGTQSIDWTDVFTAKTDITRLSIAYDRVTYIRSMNDSPNERRIKLWHPMNKTLIYDEDESGGTQFNGSTSADTRHSMGDYYVIDYFAPCNGSNAGDNLFFEPQSTLYWHER
ncbi:capsid protein [Giant panda associated gemycircularvirus]|uniref:Capsid protein n=1 Tax=Giant panda associated gemycircularvirus TaxID=2016461 RepID=A0A220IGQ8_9VIRU|nr:capsid protein [Giant panda associated gemycircularvirus]ASH99173.1 capsid protein [Giant panda associated gemycircularvirus]